MKPQRNDTLNPVQRIARNSAVPIAAQLLNKAVDFAFAFVVLRLLGVSGAGQYEFAVLVWLYTKTFTDFGLAVLATREVARDHTVAGVYLGATTLLRLGLWLVALPVVGGFTLAYWRWGNLSVPAIVAIVLLTLSIVPDSYSDAANAICNGYEEMTAPALLTIVKNLLKVAVGLGFLLAGWGAIGLAATALIVNLATAWLFLLLARRLGVRAAWTADPGAWRTLLAAAWPLLLNNLLAGLFFRVDAFILQWFRGDYELGLYAPPYKYLQFLLLIPSYFTLALFPHLSRLAAERSGALNATLALAMKLLLIVALPVCVATVFLAPDLVLLLGGRGYLPHSATALRILIWFLPFSYVNGLAQYVLIAVGRQRLLSGAFALTFGFNLVTNLLLIPRFGYPAAAATTVASELVLLVPFLWFLRRHVGPLPEPGIVLRPLVATLAMAAAAWLVDRYLGATDRAAPWLAVGLGGLTYLGALVATRGIGATERQLALRLLGRAPSASRS